MNCDEFGERLDDCLDDRCQPGHDPQLIRHARECGACRDRLNRWNQIAAVIPAAKSRNESASWSVAPVVRVVVAVAAVMLIVVTLAWSTKRAGNDLRQVAEDPTGDSTEVALAQLSDPDPIDPAGWWRQVQDHDWVGQTMPTVKSVQEGVAPLGRSLMRAVTILTVGGSNQTS